MDTHANDQIEHLEKIERDIAVGRERIARQREIVSELDRSGFGTNLGRKFLDALLETQAAHEDVRKAIIAKICG